MRFGSANPNWRGGEPVKVCESCGTEFRTYNKRRRFCSLRCRPKTPIEKLREMARKAAATKRAAPKKVRPKQKTKYVPVPPEARKRKATHKTCIQCGSDYKCTGRKQIEDRKFCSYQCHLDSGGAQRAGYASKGMALKYGAKKDANHKEIVDALKRLGADVIDLSAMGCGVPDILTWSRGEWHLCDIKNRETAYGRKGLNPRQMRWAGEWRGGPVYLLYSIDDAKALVEGRLEALKSVGGGGDNSRRGAR